jgi:hypothetical protein
MRSVKFILSGVAALSLLAGVVTVTSPAYAASASAPLDAAVQAGVLSLLGSKPANISVPVDSTGTGFLPSAVWSDATGSGNGWEGYVAASDFSYTGVWTPNNTSPALASSSAGSYIGTHDGDTYTLDVTGVSGSTISYSYSSTAGATGTGTATAGTTSGVGSNGVTITFSSSQTYAVGDSYQVQVGTQNSAAITLEDQSNQASIAAHVGSNAPPLFVNQTASVTGAPGTYGGAVPFLSSSAGTGMGQYSVVPFVGITTDINSWAATYTSNIEYTIASGPYASSASASTTTGTTNATLIGSTDINYTGSTANITVPTGTKYILATVSGAGGGGASNDDNTYGGNGALVQAYIPASSGEQLVALVGSGGGTSGEGSGGGGGLSGLFDGTPSQSTALLIAGGGGGGANDSVANLQSNGTDGSFSPILPYSPSSGALGGAGYGGGGGNQYGGNETSGVPFGLVAPSSCPISGAGGYGGGADGGCQWGGGGGAGGAGGYTGGQGGNSWSGSGTPDGSGGQGGTSYITSTATLLKSTTGGGSGGYATAGSNGYITLRFYS